ncbi:hypothetical protein AMS68_006582 [Peltaster fructicola]|uniref:Zn(2)-C6 fungal-type domain-containing protein n=1 Tax=Peltaster fructicola TaxID=286661 RepID=A0A6H0Y2B9_9PEZI|nr:hypothetical protein AMS68_006582 [Peltaster fructicola]
MAESQDGIDIPSPSVFLGPSASSDDRSPTITKHARKPSRTERATVPTAATPSLSLKPKQSKSRNGCITCKAKRLKCDEEKPGCQQCAKRKVECGGYKKDFKWRPFEDSNVKINIDRQNKISLPQRPSEAVTQDSSPVDEETQSAPPEPSRAKARKIDRTSKDSSVTPGKSTATRTDKTDSPPRAVPDQDSRDDATKEHTSPVEPSWRSTDQSASQSQLPPDELSTTNFRATPQPQPCPRHDSPTLTELLLAFPEPSPDDDDFIPFDMPNGFSMPFIEDLDLDPALSLPLLDHEAEDILRQDQSKDFDRSLWAQHSSKTGMTFPQIRGPIGYLYAEPNLAPDSPEMLALRFDKLTCGILSVMDGPTENPWRSLIWPMTQQSPALYHAVTAMTAYHSSTDLPVLRLAGHYHKHASIQYIQEGIRDNSMSDQTAIATALALGFSESWDQHTASGNTHIKGAQALVKRALAEHQENPLQGEELGRLKFLCNAWVYMDVIARLTAVDSDDSNDFDNAFLFCGAAPTTELGHGFGIDFGMPVDARLDPLMGCASTLFPLIGRVANLVKKVFRSQTNSPSVISQANDLRLLLETWEPPDFIEPPEDPTSQVQHALQTAEAYRWATLLHLHQSVPELPSVPSSELGQKVLTYLATVPLASRTTIVQIYPLMVAGCEAATEEDRQWVRDRWTAMHTRMRIGPIDKCSTVTEEVWRRRDSYEARPSQHRRLVATADLQLPRFGSGKLKRSHSSFQNSAPGRAGIVFSLADVDIDGQGENNCWPPRSTARANIGAMDPAYTVRGHLHWVGVMFEWQWEVLLG